jgi:hypothetical protein
MRNAGLLYHLNRLPVKGSDKENPVIMTCRDSHVHDSKPGIKTIYAKLKKTFGGEYTLEFEQDGTYELSRWPFG